MGYTDSQSTSGHDSSMKKWPLIVWSCLFYKELLKVCNVYYEAQSYLFTIKETSHGFQLNCRHCWWLLVPKPMWTVLSSQRCLCVTPKEELFFNSKMLWTRFIYQPTRLRLWDHNTPVNEQTVYCSSFLCGSLLPHLCLCLLN